MKANRALITRLAYFLFFVTPVCAEPAPPPLSSLEEEFGPVIVEIQSMIKTDASQVPDFVVREATTERIEKLYKRPEVFQLPRNIRENGLIFAGQGSSLLSFKKPSDIISKISVWFPEELQQARNSKNRRFSGYLHLWGPFEHWEDEPTAFMSLWNCMPQNAWLRPEQNPFVRRLDDGTPLFPIAAKQSNNEESDFGFCIHKRSGYRPSWSQEDASTSQQRLQKMGEKVVPLLSNKFFSFLKANRCRGTGPDDCVLVLRLWASMAPADVDLAASFQELEEEIGLGKPLPDMQNGDAAYADTKPEYGQERFDIALRQAAYLRAKLQSVLNAPQAWPSSALATTLHQLSQLRQVFAVPFVRRWDLYKLDYRNDPINPWRFIDEAIALHPELLEAIRAELDRLGADVDCEVFDQWFKYGDASLMATYVLNRLKRNDGHKLQCGTIDMAWLQEQESTQYRYILDGYLSSFGVFPERERERLISGLTDKGRACYDKTKMKAGGWKRDVCRRWVLRRNP